MLLLWNIEFLEMQKISILGCGWLGLPLAKEFVKLGFKVKGSTTSEKKLDQLQETGIKPFLIALTEDKIEGNMSEFLKDSDILIVNIPPKLRSTLSENFVAKIQNLISFLEYSSVQKVVFVSSTSVYGNISGSLNVTEVDLPNPETESGKQLLESEKLFQQNQYFKTSILRFGGLIGGERQPVKHLAGKENLENPNVSVNLIHQNDCIGIISKIVMNEVWGETFNAVAPYHPTRKEYYSQKAKEMNLALPKFLEMDGGKGKIINSDKLIQRLGYQFRLDLY